jgi:hypothetical protein
VPVFPSTAFAAGKLAFSVDDAVAVLFSATLAVPQVAAFAAGVARESPETRADRMRAAPARMLMVLLARGTRGAGEDLARFRCSRSSWGGMSTLTSEKLDWVRCRT